MRRERFDILFFPLGAAAMGGAERSIAYLAKGMHERGKRVLILAEPALKQTDYPRFLQEVGLPVRWVDWSPDQGRWHNFRQALKVLRSLEADIVQFNISWRRGMWIIPVVARLTGYRRLIGTMRGMPEPHEGVPSRLHFGFLPGLGLWHLRDEFIGWVWARTLDLTVSVNGLDFPPRLVEHYRFSHDKIRIVHNAVFYRDKALSEGDRSSLRERLGVGHHDVLVGYFGRLSPEKGVDLILRALGELPPRYRLVVAGDGPMEGQLRAMAEALRIDGRTTFLGFLQRPDDTMAAADVIAVPSTWQEAGSRVIVEALNQGTPVIGSRTGGTPEMVTDGVEGCIVEPGSVEDLRRALFHVGESIELRAKMRIAARQRVFNDFRMESVVSRYAAMYRELLARYGRVRS